MGYGALLLGHSVSSVLTAVRRQLEHGSLFCVPTELEVNLAELISKLVPCAQMVRIMNTGSEATMHAIRLARAFTKRKKVIKFAGGYHGAHDYVLGAAGSSAAARASQDGVLAESASNTIAVPYNDTSTLERTFEKDGDIGCIIMEPVLANIGLVLPDKDFLNDVRKITEQNDALLIFDEVVTGFRLSPGGASEFFGIKPDLATFAKALGNGFPIAAIAGRREIMEQLAPLGSVYQASTFGGNPVSVSAAIATLQSLVTGKNTVYPRIARRCDQLVDGIGDIMRDCDMGCTINSIGSMYQIFFSNEKVRDELSAKRANAKKFRRLYDLLLQQQIFIPPSQFETCFVSFAHTEDDIERTVDAYSGALQRIKTEP